MPDRSRLDDKYFVDNETYNCPFCKRRNLPYKIEEYFEFDWTDKQKCYSYVVECSSCRKKSLHHAKEEIRITDPPSFEYHNGPHFRDDIEIDDHIFVSVPAASFVLDERIPSGLRRLLAEAQESLQMNHLVGASACVRKAIYELAAKHGAEGEHYADKFRALKSILPSVDPQYFDALTKVHGLTSDHLHEESWKAWDAKKLRVLIAIVKRILEQIYVEPDEKKKQIAAITQLEQEALAGKKARSTAQASQPKVK